LELGDKYTVYSKEQIIYHPVYGSKRQIWKYERPRAGFAHNELLSSTGEPLGSQIMIYGLLEVIEVGDTTSYTNVLMAYDEINLGALLNPYQEVTEPLSTNSGNKFLEGYIVATKLDKMGVGITDIVCIDKGWENGVHAGDVLRFTISRKSRKNLVPNRKNRIRENALPSRCVGGIKNYEN
jgi:hypothetical protein